MVEHFNRPILQMLRCYVGQADSWELYLSLVLYEHGMTQYSSIGVSQLMFGHQPHSSPFKPPTAFDSNTCIAELQVKLQDLFTAIQICTEPKVSLQ